MEILSYTGRTTDAEPRGSYAQTQSELKQEPSLVFEIPPCPQKSGFKKCFFFHYKLPLYERNLQHFQYYLV
jgi:hypothetical protein